MKSLITAVLVCMLSLAFAVPQTLGNQQPAANAIDPAARDRIIESLAAAIEREYVIPQRGTEIATELRSRARQGDFSSAADSPALARALDALLTEIGRDRHLNVRFGPDPSGMAGPPPPGASLRMRNPGSGPVPGGPGAGGPMVGGQGPGGPSGGPQLPAEMLEQLRSRNFDFGKVEILPGNVGYLQIGGLHPPDLAGETAAAALRFLANTDAIILDLRSSPGGTQQMVNLLASTFLPNDGRILLTSQFRGQQPNVHTVATELPVARRADVPLYILTSKRTFSAGEALPYILQQHGRATIVGEQTAGAGNPNTFVNLGHGLTASISIGITAHPTTGTSWEGTGVIPDVNAPAGDALRRAHMEALRTLAANTSDPRRKAALEGEAAAIEWNGRTTDLQRFAGLYGERQFAVDQGVLQMIRGTNPPQPLQQIGETTFRLRDLARYEFETDAQGTIVAVTTTGPDGVRQRVTRTSPKAK
jgi:retinol-binding protein 3